LKSAGRLSASAISGWKASDDGLGRRLVAVVQVAGADHGLGHERQDPLGPRELLGRHRPVLSLGRRRHQPLPGCETLATARHERPDTACARIFVNSPAP
jgi:hypothetical protein